MPGRRSILGPSPAELRVLIPSAWVAALRRVSRPGDVSVYVRQRLHEALTAAGEQVSNPDGGRDE